MADTKLRLKLLVDKEKKVVLAECQRDFVDVLFSFLTLPVGTVVRVLKKQSQLGCMDRLYESVEKMDVRFMGTQACKSMLLRPRSIGDVCADLQKLYLDEDGNPLRFYRCRNGDCCSDAFRLYSLVQGAKCPCGLTMDNARKWTNKPRSRTEGGGGVFVKGEGSFTINDDLSVTPTITDVPLSILRKFGLEDCSGFEEMTVEVGKEEVLNLLKRSLLSDTALTDVFLRKLDVDTVAHEPKTSSTTGTTEQAAPPLISSTVRPKAAPPSVKSKAPALNSTAGNKTLKMKLVQSKSRNGTVLYAEAGGDVVDFLFSFLTFPVGSVIKLLDRRSGNGGIDNLYKSIEELIGSDYLVDSEESCKKLLSPNLAPTFACSSQLLPMDENVGQNAWRQGCQDCFLNGVSTAGSKCKHGIEDVILSVVNPKLPNPGTESGGGFVKGGEVFMITDGLEITPLSSIASIQVVGRLGIPVSDLVVREVSLGEPEALKILKASLISNRVLSSVFDSWVAEDKDLSSSKVCKPQRSPLMVFSKFSIFLGQLFCACFGFSKPVSIANK